MASIFDRAPLAPINFNRTWTEAHLYNGVYQTYRWRGSWISKDSHTGEAYQINIPPSVDPLIKAMAADGLIHLGDCDPLDLRIKGTPLRVEVTFVGFYMLVIELRKGIQPYKMFFIAGSDFWRWMRKQLAAILESLLESPHKKKVTIATNYAEYDYEWLTYQLREHFTFDDQRPEREVIDVYNIDTTDAAGWSVFPCAVPMYSLDLFNKNPLVEMVEKGYLVFKGEWDSVIKPVYGSEDNAKDFEFDWKEATKDYYPFCVDTRGY